MSEERTCESCRWWEPSDDMPIYGWCHRSPRAEYTGDEGWCGEYRRDTRGDYEFCEGFGKECDDGED